MEIEQAIDYLTKADRCAIRGLLADKYSKSYINMMFLGTRTHTEDFKKAVIGYVEGKEKVKNELQNQ